MLEVGREGVRKRDDGEGLSVIGGSGIFVRMKMKGW